MYPSFLLKTSKHTSIRHAMGMFVTCPACSGFSCTRIGTSMIGDYYRCDECGDEFMYQVNTARRFHFRFYMIDDPAPILDVTDIFEMIYKEPECLETNESWLKFKLSCQIVGIHDPWRIIVDNGQFDVAIFYNELEPEYRSAFILALHDLLTNDDIEALFQLFGSTGTAMSQCWYINL